MTDPREALAHGQRLARLGPIYQLAYVPDDFDRALDFWTRTMGAGPFLVRDSVELFDTRYLGAPSDVQFGLALGYWGEVNIELIRQNNDAPSIYRDWSNPPGRDALHHVCVIVPELDVALRSGEAAGAEIVQQARSADGTARLAYLDCGAGGPAGYFELVQMNDAWRALHGWLRDEARGWDGRDPVRRQPGGLR
jgi:catechol 2,3-dioxygenase-like lactoylglutathione lyase family enzyme